MRPTRHLTVDSSTYFDSLTWERKQLKAWLCEAGNAGLSSTEISLLVQKTCAFWMRAALLHLEDLLAKGEVARRENRWVLSDTAGAGPGGVVGRSQQGEAQLAQPESKVG